MTLRSLALVPVVAALAIAATAAARPEASEERRAPPARC